MNISCIFVTDEKQTTGECTPHLNRNVIHPLDTKNILKGFKGMFPLMEPIVVTLEQWEQLKIENGKSALNAKMHWDAMKIQSDEEYRMSTCSHCSTVYFIKETVRVYGDESWKHLYCSANCFTKSTIQGKYEIEEEDGESGD